MGQICSCLLCLAPHPGPAPLCPGCFQDLPWYRDACLRCALPVTIPGLCGRCARSAPPFDRAVAPLLYRFPVDAVIREFKFQRRLWWTGFLGEALAREARSLPRPDLLVPVPLHWRRRCWRGFNQAMEIARVAGAALDLEVDHRLVRRVRAGPRQAQLPARRRAHNLRGAFQLQRSPRVSCIAIVDDVMTTGATAGEIARLLKRAGVESVQVWAAARAV